MIQFKMMNGTKIKFFGDENKLSVQSGAGTKLYIDPETGMADMDAPFYYREIEGDFSFSGKLKLGYTESFDSAALLVYESDTLWARAGITLNENGVHNIVSIITEGISDYAQGISIEGNEVWLKLSRKGDNFTVHYSFDGDNYILSRMALISAGNILKVGVTAQAPMGESKEFFFENLEHKS